MISLAVLAAVAVVSGCSPAARDRLVNFFFEVPASQAPDAGNQSAEGPPPADTAAPSPQTTAAYKPSAHDTAFQNRCDACHSADQRMKVDDETLMSSCQECHSRFFGDEVGHEPVTDGDCLLCHTIHHSAQDHLLLRPVLALCVDCHGEPADLIDDGHPSDADHLSHCTTCHNPHFGSGALLRPGLGAAPAED